MNMRIDRRPLLVASLLGSAIAAVGCTALRSAADVENLIADRSRDWTACFANGRTEVMVQILAEDFVGTGPDGTSFDKREAILSAAQGPNVFAASRMDSIKVKVFDGVALAFGHDLLTLKAASSSQTRTSWTDTWLLRRGVWQVVASHESVVKAAGPR